MDTPDDFPPPGLILSDLYLSSSEDDEEGSDGKESMIQPQQPTAVVDVPEWGEEEDADQSEDENDGTKVVPDGDINFEIKEIQIAHISTKLQTMANARMTSIRKCPKRVMRKMTPARKKKQPLSFSERGGDAIRKAWFEELRKLQEKQPDFFTSQEATLEDDSRAVRGKPAYSALPITQFNNADIQDIYLTEYDRKIRNGGSFSTFLQLVTVAGQFLRLHIVLGFTQVKECCNSGALYRALCDRDVIDIFLNYYDAKGQCTTVMTKALHLRKISEYAKIHFSDRDLHLKAEAERSRMKLQKVYNSQKSMGRSRANQRKQMEERVAEGTVFFEADFQQSLTIVNRNLDGLLSFYESVKNAQGMEQAVTSLDRQDILRKWSMNLLLMLIFSAAGQRPQVYTTLQCPDDNELTAMTDQAKRIKFFEMRTTVEKTKRKTDYPNVLVHVAALKFVTFHQQVARKLIVRRSGVDETLDLSTPFLMHTETGEFLTTPQVTRVLKNFIKYNFPDLKNITMMSLRSSYGTIMMAAYREKRIFRDLGEDDFLAILGKVMNTSVEQLMTTYIGVERTEFEKSAKELSKILSVCDDESNESGSGGSRGNGNAEDGRSSGIGSMFG